MAQRRELREPWLVAVWPGMGNVALGAGAYLVSTLEAELVAELPARDLFDIEHVEVRDGLATAGRLPRNMIFQWHDPNHRHDLIIFVGEAQPTLHGSVLCDKLAEYALQRGVKRVFTFAAMASQLHPSTDPRVFAAVTDRQLLDELEKQDVEILKEGQISGLNGVLLAAAAEHKLQAVCLLGELPFFAAGVPSPKASKAVLEVFTDMMGIEMEFGDLETQSEAVERHLLELMERLNENGESEQGFPTPGLTLVEEGPDEKATSKKQEPQLDQATRQRVERMFDIAQRDRSKAYELKRELDRLGAFKLFEDRFLDLFRKAD